MAKARNSKRSPARSKKEEALDEDRLPIVLCAHALIIVGIAMGYTLASGGIAGLLLGAIGGIIALVVFSQAIKSMQVWPLERCENISDAMKKGRVSSHLLSKFSPTRHLVSSEDVFKVIKKISKETTRIFLFSKKNLPKIQQQGKEINASFRKTYLRSAPPPPDRSFKEDACLPRQVKKSSERKSAAWTRQRLSSSAKTRPSSVSSSVVTGKKRNSLQ